MKKFLSFVLAMTMVLGLFTGCGKKTDDSNVVTGVQSTEESPDPVTEAPAPAEEVPAPAEEEALPLEGHTLHIFCGAGMKAAFEEIAAAFQEQTGCAMEVTYANAAQIQTQINTAQEGDFFIAGSQEELKPVEEMVSSATPLVKHIPVLAVQLGNPKGITSAADLSKEGVRMVIGDPEATPVGKIAMKLFKDFDLMDQVEIVSNTATAPAMNQALAADECDVILVWKENVNPDVAEIVETTDMDNYVKQIPAAQLTCSADQEAADSFLTFLGEETARDLWVGHGYELVQQ